MLTSIASHALPGRCQANDTRHHVAYVGNDDFEYTDSVTQIDEPTTLAYLPS